MSTTAPAPPRPPAPTAAPAPPKAPKPRRGDPLLSAAEVALALVGLATAFGFCRIFLGWSFFAPLALASVASSLLAGATRRGRWPVVASGLVSLLGLAVLLTITFHRDTSALGLLPTRATWHAFQGDLRVAWSDMATAVAPVKAENGYLAIAMAAAWISAWMADGLAFRAAALIEPLVPPALVFVFVSGLAGDRLRILSVVVWLASALVAYAILRARQTAATTGWLTAHRRGAMVTSLRVAAILGVAALLAGLILGPSLPGASSTALISPQNVTSHRTLIAPLVDIRGQIASTSEVELFTVQSSEPAYWRLLSLDTFDGTVWSAKQIPTGRVVPGGVDASVPAREVIQNYIVNTLDSKWLPAAYVPSEVSADDATLDSETSTISINDPTTTNYQYQITSHVPEVDANTLRSATGTPPSSISSIYLELPSSFPHSLRTTAEQIVAGANTPFDEALALQNFFRDNFTYDLSVKFGNDNKAIEEFLKARRGYCEQFAGTYAALARALGLPTRVAVGFTPGTVESDGRYHVLDKHAHAWPEVYFTGIGWLPFEPTPSRGNPDATSYTGVAAAQNDDSTPPSSNGTGSTVAGTTRTTTAANGANGGSTGTTIPAVAPSRHHATAIKSFLVTLAVVLGAIALWLTLVPLVSRWRWRWRLRKAGSPAGRVLVEWREATEALGRAGIRRKLSETPYEFVDRALAGRLLDRHGLQDMAATATRAGFGPDDLTEGDVEWLRGTRRILEKRLWSEAGWRERLAWLGDPRPLLRRG
jgi:transglutaminase-like putative cysteine protease